MAHRAAKMLLDVPHFAQNFRLSSKITVPLLGYLTFFSGVNRKVKIKLAFPGLVTPDIIVSQYASLFSVNRRVNSTLIIPPTVTDFIDKELKLNARNRARAIYVIIGRKEISSPPKNLNSFSF